MNWVRDTYYTCISLNETLKLLRQFYLSILFIRSEVNNNFYKLVSSCMNSEIICQVFMHFMYQLDVHTMCI